MECLICGESLKDGVCPNLEDHYREMNKDVPKSSADLDKSKKKGSAYDRRTRRR